MTRVQSFRKRSAVEWSKVLYIYIYYIYIYIYILYIQREINRQIHRQIDRQIDRYRYRYYRYVYRYLVVRVAVSQFIAIQLIQDLIQKIGTITKQNITKRAFSRKKGNFILSSFRQENIFMTFQQEEQFWKMDTHFSQINTCHATQLLMCLYVQLVFFSYFNLKIS